MSITNFLYQSLHLQVMYQIIIIIRRQLDESLGRAVRNITLIK